MPHNQRKPHVKEKPVGTDDRGRPIFGYHATRKDVPVCHSRRCKRPGRCQSVKRMANGRCHKHGGASPVGPAQPSYKHGKYSKYLPPRMLATYDEGQTDAELLTMRAEVELVDMRIKDLMTRVDTGEASSKWQALTKQLNRLREADAKDDKVILAKVAKELMLIFPEDGYNDFEIWNEMWPLVDQRNRLLDSEARRMVALHQMISVDQFIRLTQALLAMVHEHVKDPKALTAIAAGIAALLNRPGPGN